VTSPSLPTPAHVEEHSAETVLEPPYHLVLLDDDDHSYAYVIEMLGKVFGYGKEKAYVLACIVDSEGRVTVETATHEQVTGHQQQIHAYGADPRIARCKGSMSAVVEEAP
jgi:ATP-dependent Clp protease adaptor protein ClpS